MADTSHKKLNALKHKKRSNFHKNSGGAAKSSEAKIKSQSTPAVQSKLPSNWEKYEEDNEEHAEATPTGGIDFGTLTVLSSQNSNFQLKQDKIFMPRSSALKVGDVFKLDMSLLNLGLATIPFYQRIEIGKEALTEDEIKIMDKAAVNANDVYQTYLAKKSGVAYMERNGEFATIEEIELRTDDLDTVAEGEETETSHLEEWLEQIL